MATYQGTSNNSLDAGEDLSASLGAIVTISGGALVKTSAATQTPVGIIAEELNAVNGAIGKAVTYAPIGSGGIAKVKAGAAITAGHLVVSDANGLGVSGGADQNALVANVTAIGIAIDAATAANEIIRVQLMPLTSSVGA